VSVQHDARVSETYQWVDRYPDPQEAVWWQERVDGWPVVRRYKRRTHQLLAGAERVLDVGCGPGSDLLAAGAVGLDRSLVMLERARELTRRSVVAGDAAALPFADAVFDGVRADRLVQHVDDPPGVLDELVRVVAPGGVVVVADPDQGTLVLEVPGASAELVALVARRRRDVQYRNGRMARRLPAEFARRGLVEVTVDAFGLVLTDPDEAFGLPTWVDHALQVGTPGFVEDHRAEWDVAMQRARAEPGFVYAVTYFVVSGRRTCTSADSPQR
jgi:SAM-dependent methyltransferase